MLRAAPSGAAPPLVSARWSLPSPVLSSISGVCSEVGAQRLLPGGAGVRGAGRGVGTWRTHPSQQQTVGFPFGAKGSVVCIVFCLLQQFEVWGGPVQASGSSLGCSRRCELSFQWPISTPCCLRLTILHPGRHQLLHRVSVLTVVWVPTLSLLLLHFHRIAGCLRIVGAWGNFKQTFRSLPPAES